MPVTALPDSAGDASPETSAVVERVHDSAIASVLAYRCICENEYLRSERCCNHFTLAVGLKGFCQVHDGRRRYLVDPASTVLHHPGSTYRTSHPYGCNDSGVIIAFREDVAQEVHRGLGRGQSAPAMNLATRPMRPALRQLVLVMRGRRGLDVDAVTMDEIVMDLLSSAVGTQPGGDAGLTGTGAVHRGIVNAAREYLNANLSGTIRLDDVARHAGVSPFHLSRVFRRQTGLPLRTYLHHLRLGAAVHALLDTDRAITRIALDTGFSSHAHFTSLFARKLGVPPSHVRRLLNPGADLRRSPLFVAARPQEPVAGRHN